MALKIVTPAASEAVLTSDAKAHLRVTFSDDDGYIAGLVSATSNVVEAMINRSLITQTWKQSFDHFPACREIYLPRPPLGSVTWVKYYDTAGVQQTLSSSLYHVDTDSEPGRIVLADGQSWPSTQSRPNAVQIQFVAGYGDDGTAIPAQLKLGIKNLVSHWYTNRESVGAIEVAKVPQTLEYLLLPWKVY